MKQCPICQSKLENIGKNNDHLIYQCVSCGLGVTDQLKANTREYHRDLTYQEEETLFKNIFTKRLKIINKYSKPGKVLEIGCSTGIFLSLLKSQGWKELGIEVSPKSFSVAKNRGLNVILSAFEKVDFKNSKFDLVILNHTLEHLEDPEKVLSKIYSLLNDNGLIFIDVPNFGSLSAKIYSNKWSLLLPQEHLWHFTYQSLEILLKKSGFKIIYQTQVSGIWNMDYPLKEIVYSLISFKKRFIKEILFALPDFFVSKLNLGSSLIMVAKKDGNYE